MSRQVCWTKVILEAFIEEALLNHTEEQIMRLRCSNYTRIEIAEILHMELSTLDHHVARLKRKYDEAQKTSIILPKRKWSAKETYLDTH